MANEQSQGEHDDTILFAGELPIKYYGNEDVVGVFVDQVIVSHLGGVFTLYFYQMQVPPLLGTEGSTEAKLRAIEELKQVPAKCVARVVLTPTLMEQFYGAIETNMDRFKRQAQKPAPKVEE
jgi:hypothetical protein